MAGAADDAVQDGIGRGGVLEEGVLLVEPNLGRHQGGTVSGTVIHHLEKVAALHSVDGVEAPVIEDQKINTGQVLKVL